ncbi:MAG: hypothetical protein V2A76_13670 [Planctomycetota bacterium]
MRRTTSLGGAVLLVLTGTVLAQDGSPTLLEAKQGFKTTLLRSDRDSTPLEQEGMVMMYPALRLALPDGSAELGPAEISSAWPISGTASI